MNANTWKMHVKEKEMQTKALEMQAKVSGPHANILNMYATEVLGASRDTMILH